MTAAKNNIRTIHETGKILPRTIKRLCFQVYAVLQDFGNKISWTSSILRLQLGFATTLFMSKTRSQKAKSVFSKQRKPCFQKAGLIVITMTCSSNLIMSYQVGKLGPIQRYKLLPSLQLPYCWNHEIFRGQRTKSTNLFWEAGGQGTWSIFLAGKELYWDEWVFIFWFRRDNKFLFVDEEVNAV